MLWSLQLASELELRRIVIEGDSNVNDEALDQGFYQAFMGIVVYP
jgi:hypothetical protein